MDGFGVAILSVIKSLSVNLPVLKDWGYLMHKLPWLVVAEQEWRRLGQYFANGNYYLDALMSGKTVSEKITLCSPVAAVMYYVPESREWEFAQSLARVTRMGQVAGKQMQVLPIIISEHLPISENAQNLFFVINLEEKIEWNLILEDVVPQDDELPLVKKTIEEQNMVEASSEERTLLAAACFLYPPLCRAGFNKDFEWLLNSVREAVCMDENLSDTVGLSEVFIRVINRWHEKVEFEKVFELPDLESSVTKNWDEVVLFDSEFIYLKDALFKHIAEPLVKIISINALKRQLVEDNVLCTDVTNTFTVKVSYCNVAGQFCRERMLRFDRKKLEILGEEEMIEACLRRRERRDAGSW